MVRKPGLVYLHFLGEERGHVGAAVLVFSS
jgi:hypothetical protein